MATFEVGDEVVLLDGTSLTGVVIEETGYLDFSEIAAIKYKVSVNGSDGRWYSANELAPAQPAPASGDGVADDSGYTELIDEVSGRIKGLERELAAANELIHKKEIQQKMYKHTIELHEEQYNQARDNATLIRRALQKHAPEAWAEVAKQLNQNVNEYDKLMSDASRGREALAQLAASEAARAAAVEAAHELRLQVIDLDGWKTEALNRGIILERFYVQVYELNDAWGRSKGALKRNDVIHQLSNLLRGFRTWSPTSRAAQQQANQQAAGAE